MPSNQFVLAYHSKKPLLRRELKLRVEAVDRYVDNLHPNLDMETASAQGVHTGLIAWSPKEDPIEWPQFSAQNDRAVAWVNIPEHDASSGGLPNVFELGQRICDPSADIVSFGAPFACLYWKSGTLTVVNDALGLARLYSFSFGDLTVWATRPGLAHIFAAVEMKKNSVAWSGMATLGWNLGGVSHVGAGTQLPGFTRTVADSKLGVITTNYYSEWVGRQACSEPEWDAAAHGMQNAMSLGSYFEQEPVADLSGGKDSRVLAAAALRSGVTRRVRTLRTDHGEVETAQRLIELYGEPVNHEIRDIAQPKNLKRRVPFDERLMLSQRAYEGSLLPVTAIAGAPFRGFGPMRVARFNGHGGESLQGGALFGGAWRAKLDNEGAKGALNRMMGMISAPLGISKVARETATAAAEWRIREGEKAGLTRAHGLLNYFYNSERMPFWSSSFSSRSTLTPYYSSGLLDRIAQTYWGETGFSSFHKEILADLVPSWAEVPFYKPQGVVRRATGFFWENDDWSAIRAHILERVGSISNFDEDAIVELVRNVDAGDASKALEVGLARFLWEASVDSFLDEINQSIVECQAALSRGNWSEEGHRFV